MGLSKSKQTKPGQPGFPGQSSFPGQPGAGFAGFGSAPGFGAQATSAFPGQATLPGFGAQAGAGYPPLFQSGFQLPGQANVFGTPGQTGSGFAGGLGFPQNNFQSSPYMPPVSYPNHVFKPLIPGYASAPGNDQRRQNAIEQEQHDFVPRYYGEQMPQMGQMQQMHKPRKH